MHHTRTSRRPLGCNSSHVIHRGGGRGSNPKLFLFLYLTLTPTLTLTLNLTLALTLTLPPKPRTLDPKTPSTLVSLYPNTLEP